MKLKWKVNEVPTGRYRSFHKRGWPSCLYSNDNLAAQIYSSTNQEYVPSQVKAGTHDPLNVWVTDWSARKTNPAGPAFTWRKLKKTFSTLSAAKAAAEGVLSQHPEFHPPEKENEVVEVKNQPRIGGQGAADD